MLAADEQRPTPWSPPSPLPVERLTARLRLRFFVPEDARSFLGALNVDRHTFLPWLPWVLTDNRTLAEVIFNFERFRRDRERELPVPDDFVIGVFDRASGEVVGGTGLHRIIHAAHEAEIGYWVRADRRGEGLCTEATAGLISWAFTDQKDGGWGFRRVHIRCAERNLASQRVPAKLGLKQEATLRAHRWAPEHGWVDTLAWGVLADEWDCEADALKRS